MAKILDILKKKGAPLVSLHDLFIVQLYDLYDVEKKLIKELPKMVKKANSTELQELIEEHLKETEIHAERLEKIFSSLGEKPKSIKSQGLVGLLDDAKEMLSMKGEPAVLDAGIIAAAQHVEHHEIAGYGTAAAWARLMGHDEAAELLEMTLAEEKMADEKLTLLAETVVNTAAEIMGEEDTEE